MLLLLSAFAARTARAQEWLSDRRYSEGIGIKLSEGSSHAFNGPKSASDRLTSGTSVVVGPNSMVA